MRRLWGYGLVLMAIVGTFVVSENTQVHAQNASSSSYQVLDTQFGGSSASQTCSSTYCAQSGIGVPTAGQTSGSNGSANTGPVTGSDPNLNVTVEGGASDLGVLTTESTATKTMVVKITSYLTDGYTLQISGNPPSYAGHTLTALASPTASIAGVEQFGINVVANTSPAIGANPLYVPSSQTSFGSPVSGYDTPNLFKYVNGDIIAHSTKSSGETDYTISMIVNISNMTPAGHYSGDFSAVVVPVY